MITLTFGMLSEFRLFIAFILQTLIFGNAKNNSIEMFYFNFI